MAILVQDNFNRADSPTSLGTATSGQVWSQVLGPSGAFGVNSNTALWTWNFGDVAGRVVIESNFSDCLTKATLINPEVSPQNFGVGVGIICRYVDENFYWQLMYLRFPGVANRLRLQRIYNGLLTTAIDVSITLAANDTISIGCCGTDFEIFVNDVSQGTYDDSLNPQNYGTKCGLTTTSGSYFSTLTRNFDDFLVTTFGTCTPTYNCTGAGCVDPGDGTGTYATLEACLAACVIAESYNCVDGTCVDPGDGTGTFATLLECQQSGCANLQAETQKFDAGNGSEWMLLAQLSDSGDELRSKNIKAGYIVGKVTNADFTIYPVDVGQSIDVEAMEAGTRTAGATRPQSLPDTDGVAQSPRKQVNVVNAVTHTIRVSGNDTGEETRDRIDQVTYEQDIQGVRR